MVGDDRERREPRREDEHRDPATREGGRRGGHSADARRAVHDVPDDAAARDVEWWRNWYRTEGARSGAECIVSHWAHCLVPTLLEVCDFPPAAVGRPLDGVSFAPVLADPAHPGKAAAFGSFALPSGRPFYMRRSDRWK